MLRPILIKFHSNVRFDKAFYLMHITCELSIYIASRIIMGEVCLRHPVIFTDCSKGMLLLWNLFLIYVSRLSFL